MRSLQRIRLVPLWGVLLLLLSLPLWAQPPQRFKLAGRNVAVWEPRANGKVALVLFSHGFRGINTQSAALMRALAGAGYLVVAPNHADYLLGPDGMKLSAQQDFDHPEAWTDETYRDRAEDLLAVYSALQTDAHFRDRLDFSKVVLMGHSLGGYTILGLSGARPGWEKYRIPARALICLSPYLRPYLLNGGLAKLNCPVMYQGGTKDDSITPYISRAGEGYDQTSSPKLFVEFEGAGHTAWTTLERGLHRLIQQYTLAFLSHYVQGQPEATMLSKATAGVAELRRLDR